ncbi:tripartite tricarboxylate transporter TctB family protein [Devosia rhizoryzae]|uniref:Tripartite tricarboxylate transporter TctB family protein n=1 Tax=Devosia rhizoryzae TaxID=2774137 RepID=A0ABX7C3X5_9HYPH|nr:tripartite tricarboxylate transporter TctB family protein [Devosia rhizoryzae]QQR38447.1 tripartite tricarboxylate transporter TctB family protein [Devosia rhizoryzae]
MKITQDLVQGALFSIIGLVALVMALQFPLGTPNRMGPGFFPVVISALLLLTGIAILMRGRLGKSEVIAMSRWWPIAIVTVAIIVFGFLLDKLGLPVSVLLLCIGAGTASITFALNWKAVAGAVAFSAACGLLFVTLLGLPIPLVGSWLQVLAVR